MVETPIRIFVKRPTPLNDLNVVYIRNFTADFNVELWQQIGSEAPTRLHDEKFIPTSAPTPPPEPPVQEGNVLWDSNVDGKWNNGTKRLVDDKEGNINPNGKGLHMEASGDPVLEILGTGEALLRCKPGHGRAYIAACNFNSQLEMEFNIMSAGVDNLSLKLRSRHQMGDAPENRFGGFGNAISLSDVDFKTEAFHNDHENSIGEDLSKKLQLNKWYKTRYTCKNTEDNKAVEFLSEIDYGNGYETVLSGRHNSPKDYFMDKAKFEEHSEVWIRMNNEANGLIGLRNVKLTAL